MKPAQKILMIQLRQLGDILLTTPCMRAIKEANPQNHISFLSHSMGREILKDSPYIDELLIYNDKDWWAYTKFALSLHRQGYDLVFDFMANPRSAMLAWLTRCPRRISFDTRRNWAFTELVPRSKDSDYIVREKFTLLHAAGFATHDESLIMPWNEKDLGPFHQLMSDESFRNAPLRIVLSPTHRRENRRWPLEHYVTLAERLVREKNAAVIWSWGPGEEDIIQGLVRQCAVRTFASPKTTLRELTALLANSHLFIGNANGASHFAVAADCATLKLCGPHTETQAWSPLNDKHRVVKVWDDIRNLDVETVWSAIFL